MSLHDSIRALASSLEIWLVVIPFAVYVGFFNSISSLLSQIMVPYGYSEDEAGIAGALLIVVGLVTAAVTAPVLDRTRALLTAIKIAVPIVALSYLAFVWMPATHSSGLAGPYVVLSILGAASFSLVPVAVEFLVELAHPVSPEVTSTLGWAAGQFLGGCFILISDALKAGPAANPPRQHGPRPSFHRRRQPGRHAPAPVSRLVRPIRQGSPQEDPVRRASDASRRDQRHRAGHCIV